MIVHRRENMGFFNNDSRKKLLSNNCAAADCSPLLIPHQWNLAINNRDEKEIVVDASISSRGGEEVIEIKELCESPKSSHRFSMFSFTPPGPTHHHQQHQSPTNTNGAPDTTISSLEVTPTPSNHSSSSPPLDRKRYMIINEVISTEAKYIDNLNTILTVFLPALEHVVTPRDLRLLVPAQLEVLMETHQELLDNLKQRMSGEAQFYGFVGDIFSRLCGHSNLEFFNMYRVYMGEFKIAMQTLSRYNSESEQFKEILSLLQQSPVCERLDLASYLLTPIQRLPRYELLLKELQKYTPLEHPDNYYIGEALARLHKVLTKLNLSIKSCQLACSASTKSFFRINGKSLSRKTSRRASRTLSALKRFVSTTNIDEYSSGDSATEDLPSTRMPRRYRGMTNSSTSFGDSDIDISSSMDTEAETSLTSFRDDPLVGNRAVSCSDLLLGLDLKKHQKLHQHILAPLASEPCTPDSSRPSSVISHRNSFISSSSSSSPSPSSSLSSSDPKEESLTPTGIDGGSQRFAPPQFSTPIGEDETGGDRCLTLKPSRGLELSSLSSVENESQKKKNIWRNALRVFKSKNAGPVR